MTKKKKKIDVVDAFDIPLNTLSTINMKSCLHHNQAEIENVTVKVRWISINTTEFNETEKIQVLKKVHYLYFALYRAYIKKYWKQCFPDVIVRRSMVVSRMFDGGDMTFKMRQAPSASHL